MNTTTKTHGGKRAGAGRKPKSLEEQLREDFDVAWPQEKRRQAIEAMNTRALNGDVAAFRVLMAYAYGTPPSGDEMRLEEAVDTAIEELLSTLEKSLSPTAWREVEIALGIASNP